MWNDLVIEALRSTRRRELDLGAFGLGNYALGSVGDRRIAIDEVLGRIKYLPHSVRKRHAEGILHAAAVKAPEGLMLRRDSLRALQSMGFEIGSHTVDHPILANAPPDEAWREILESKSDLERSLGSAVTLFAYPNGRPGKDYTADHVRMVREAGFAVAVSTAPGAARRTSDPLQLPRFMPWTRRPIKFDLLMLRNLWHGMEATIA
jgi:hypothetical protein